MSSPSNFEEAHMERAGRLVGKMNLPPQLADAETRARAAWAVAAGKKIARHTKATALVRGTLLVEVGDTIWQRQLAPLRNVLLGNLARELGAGLVSEIDFRPTPARRPPQPAMSARPVPEKMGPAYTDGIQDPVLALLYRRSRENT
jgi:predicted nucleic acid-binding Zn ribbon protein